MPDARELIAAMRQRCEAATGPAWESRELAFEPSFAGDKRRVYRVEIVAPQYTFGKRTHSRLIAQVTDYCEWNDHPANVEFITHSRTDHPRALAALEIALAELERLMAVVADEDEASITDALAQATAALEGK